MKFINYIEKIGNVNVYGLLSLIIFIAVFVLAVVWVYRTPKKSLGEISRIPLDN